MCCKIALDSDLPIPRSALLTFPFEAYLDSPGIELNMTNVDLRILIKNTIARAKRKSTKLSF